jgi:hypothetical protein
MITVTMSDGQFQAQPVGIPYAGVLVALNDPEKVSSPTSWDSLCGAIIN